MSAITEQIITKLHNLEKLSESTLDLILDFVCVVEARLTKNSKNSEDPLPVSATETSCFDLTQDLIGIGDELPTDLSTNAEHMTGYGL